MPKRERTQYMVEMINLRSPQLIEAVLLWSGHGTSPMPRRDVSLLVKRFGPQLAGDLIPTLKALEEDFYLSDAKFTADNLQEMEVLSSAQFRSKHPDVANEIVKAFAWCYTFDFK
jgi:hypothetical protein